MIKQPLLQHPPESFSSSYARSRFFWFFVFLWGFWRAACSSPVPAFVTTKSTAIGPTMLRVSESGLELSKMDELSDFRFEISAIQLHSSIILNKKCWWNACSKVEFVYIKLHTNGHGCLLRSRSPWNPPPCPQATLCLQVYPACFARVESS